MSTTENKSKCHAGIRLAQRTDAEFIYDSLLAMVEEEMIANRFSMTRNDLSEALFGKSAIAEALVAEMNDVQIGFLLFSETNRNFTVFSKSGLYIHDLYVMPSFRRIGIASRMMEEIKSIAKKRDYDRIDWVVLKDNDIGQVFYDAFPDVKNVDYIKYMRIVC